MLTPLLGSDHQCQVRRITVDSEHVASIDQRCPIGARQPTRTSNQCRRTMHHVEFSDFSHKGERRKIGIDMSPIERSDVFDTNTIDGVNLCDHQIDKIRVGQANDQFVNHVAGTRFKDLDAEDVAANRADTARDLAKRARAIRKPDPDDDGVHRGRLCRECFSHVTVRCQLPESGQAATKVAHRLGNTLLVLDERKPHVALTAWTKSHAW